VYRSFINYFVVFGGTISNKLIPWSKDLRSRQSLSYSRIPQKCYRTRKIITVFTRASRWSLSWAISIQSIPLDLIYLRALLILSFHPCIGLPSGIFPSCFPIKILYAFLFSHACYMPCPSHPSNYSNYIWQSIISSLLGPNILLSTLLSNTLSLCSSFNVRDQVSHPYKTTGKIIVFYILIFTFLDSRREDKKGSELNGSNHYPTLIYSYFPHGSNFDLLLWSPNIWNLPHFQRGNSYAPKITRSY
jgi:hypothetical protein